MDIHESPEFSDWLSELRPHERTHVDDRLDRIRQHHHFGDRKYLGDGLFELRWRNGRRTYFAMASDGSVVLLLGGRKDGQERDIAHARRILEREDH